MNEKIVSVCGVEFTMTQADYDKNKITVDEVELPLPSTLPVELNDVDLDAYTNTKGRTIRGRVREDVVGLELSYNVINGIELNSLLNTTRKEWLNVSWFSEKANARVTQKFYRSKLNYEKYYVCDNRADCRYINVTFSFVEE